MNTDEDVATQLYALFSPYHLSSPVYTLSSLNQLSGAIMAQPISSKEECIYLDAQALSEEKIKTVAEENVSPQFKHLTAHRLQLLENGKPSIIFTPF